MPIDDWDRALAINLTGTMLSARAVLPAMIAAGGRGNTPYDVARGGVPQLMRSMAAN